MKSPPETIHLWPTDEGEARPGEEIVCVDMLAYDHLLDFIAHFDFIVDLASLGVHLT